MDNMAKGVDSGLWYTRYGGSLKGLTTPCDETNPESVEGARRGNELWYANNQIGKTKGRHIAWFDNVKTRVPEYRK